ncbi:MAG TPA: glycoside hydrolase family 3 N-terminal domain-containing protein [Puia sp.]|nr:glycoside hydrolase family 3 N-terminal domain-containing protein [Puia sp.]
MPISACNKFRGDWCSENEYLDREILRKELGFKGVLITDWSAAHSTVKAALAGLDLEMGTDKKDYNEWYFADPLINAVETGKVPVSVLDEKVANVLRVRIKTKTFDEQSPAHALGNFPGRNLKVNYEEDILVGYRWFDTKKIVPLFPLGHGLSILVLSWVYFR